MRRRVGRMAVLAVVVGVAGCGGGAEKKGDAAGGTAGGAAQGEGGRGGGEDMGRGPGGGGASYDIGAAVDAFTRKVTELGAKGFPAELGPTPVLAVERVVNRTRSHLDVEQVVQALTDRLVATGQVRVVPGAASADREALREQEDLAAAEGRGDGVGGGEAPTGLVVGEISDERTMGEDGQVSTTTTYAFRLLGTRSHAVLVSSSTSVRTTRE